jgi:hypothetical protein
MNKDLTYILAKQAYHGVPLMDLEEAGLSSNFDLLTSQQKDFFCELFDSAHSDFKEECSELKEEYHEELRDQFLSTVANDLGFVGSDTVESILDLLNLKVVKK